MIHQTIYNVSIALCLCTLFAFVFSDSPEAMRDLVTDLPGQSGVRFRHYAGYVPVDKKHGRAMFYWFFEAMSLPNQKPLVLWLNGGPGCSSVGYGATQEIGPFLVDNKGNSLQFNPYAWNHEANILFLESPVGVGFSYSNTSSDYKKIGDEFTARDAYSFIQNWLERFPAYRENNFYIAGESYAGKYIPELAEVVYDKNNENSSLHIKLKGILLGNPETSEAEDWDGWVDYAWSHAVISDEMYGVIKRNCNFSSKTTWDVKECKDNVDEVVKQYHKIDQYSLYTPTCNGNSTPSSSLDSTRFRTNLRNSKMMPRMMGGYDPCLDDYTKVFYNRADVQKALHASDGIHLKNWSICNDDIFDNWTDSKPSVLPIYKKLIAGGFRIWVYSGDTDGRVPVLGTRYCINKLALPIKTSWTPWYHEKQVSGWLQEYEGLTFGTFKGAGHDVPSFKPSESLAFFSAFLKGVLPALSP
ncbi:serine carboxypeptidase-like 32 [Brassica napus]|uniref:serine carboxypeptidase-like 32 n=1 Tax=Brassica napus TaxID=3708 RepID=UPI00207881B8|nr:serine carboxypeptidase-like 32 [Brassica napus]